MLHSNCVAAYFHMCISHNFMLESYAGNHVCISESSKLDIQEWGFRQRHPGAPGCVLGIGLTSQSHKKKFLEKTVVI